jgi:isoleucyl-tRNA synthetase
MTRFEQVKEDERPATIELRILAYWKSIHAFERSLELSRGRPEFVFYDGPPFATGLPHYGHILAGTIKDVVTRYAYQTGHAVPRVFGWDTHGLPVEHEIDKREGITDRQQVLDMGIGVYNEKCRAIVMQYQSEWEAVIERTGRWIDFKNPYKTMDVAFMESVWWVCRQLWDRGLIYRGLKVMHYSTGCKTPISNFEAGENYRDVSDPAISVAFKAVGQEYEFVAWTTTPWTLPSNLILAVNKVMTYVRVKDLASGRQFILMKERLGELYRVDQKGKKAGKPEFEILAEFPGAELVGQEYEPLFPFFREWSARGSFHVFDGAFVSSTTGTGIVHCAAGFGEEDFDLCMAKGIIEKGGDIVCPIDDNGCFTQQVTDWAGLYVKDADKHIVARLKADGRLIKSGSIVHSVGFCWRSDTPLLRRAIPSWYIKVEDFRDAMIANVKETTWVPPAIRDGRFIEWLASAHDWAFSRNRYWGTPIPIWTDDDYTEFVCVGSIAELEALTGRSGFTDLHMHNIGDITITSQTTGKELHRIPEVFDCWFESGSMPFSQFHIPFSGREWRQADFIAEGLDQTRGWFYTLTVLSTLMGHGCPFKNLIVNGLVLAEDGRKMSKRLKNFPLPEVVMDEHGADALRLYLVNSPAVRAEPMRFRPDLVKQVVRDVLLPWLNTLNFFVQQVICHGNSFVRDEQAALASQNTLDRWILSRLHEVIRHVHKEMQAFRLYTVLPELVLFIGDMTNWYLRLNRDRLKSGSDAVLALGVLFEVLYNLSLVMAVFAPFFAEFSYLTLRPALDPSVALESVHFLMLPQVNESLIDPVIQRRVGYLTSAILIARQVRDKEKVPVRRPLAEVVIVCSEEIHRQLANLEPYIVRELNVLKVTFRTNEQDFLKFAVVPDSRILGKRFARQLKDVTAALGKLSYEFCAEIYARALAAQRAGQPPPEFEPLKGLLVNTDEVKLTRELTLPPGSQLSGGVIGEVAVFCDLSVSDEIVQITAARELRYRVQRTRKELHLRPSDRIGIFVVVEDGDNDVVKTGKSTNPVIASALGLSITLSEPPDGSDLIGRVNSELNGTPFAIVLVRAD